MYRLARLADWTRSRPSTLLNLPGDGYDPSQCLDFDLAVLDWWDRFGAFRDERKLAKLPKIAAGMSYVPKYGSDADILRTHYGVGRPDGSALDPVVAAMTDDDLWSLVDGWDA